MQVTPFADYFCAISNHDDLTILTPGEDWDTFRVHFRQTCAWKPVQRELLKRALKDHEKKESLTARAVALMKHSRRYRRFFSVLLSTELNHKADKLEFFGPFSHIRETLDYDYHVPYTYERQKLQDAIINDMLGTAVIKDTNGDVCTTPTEPWIVFTAGAMGAGKTHTMKMLMEKGRFPILAFVTVDPDEIRRHLPEFHLYLEQSPELAGELTRKEAGFIAEILTLAGLQAGKNVLVDGSLRDVEWYKGFFERLRKRFPKLRLAIIHVTAPRDAIFQRAAVRQH
jgi:predicted kinase